MKVIGNLKVLDIVKKSESYFEIGFKHGQGRYDVNDLQIESAEQVGWVNNLCIFYKQHIFSEWGNVTL